MLTRSEKVQRERLLLAFLLMVGSVVFFTLFEQAATSLNLFAERNTNLALAAAPAVFNLFGHEVFVGTRAMLAAARPAADVWWIDNGLSAAQTQSFNAGFILIFAPLFAALWTVLGRRGRDIDPVTKFGLGLAQVGLSFLLIVWCRPLADAQLRFPLLLLATVYLLQTTGELCLSPVGLSEITKLSPPALVSTMMAVWFLGSSAAEYIGGFIAGLAGTATAGGKVLDPVLALDTALGVFGAIGWTAVGFGVAFLLGARFVRGWAHAVPMRVHPAQPEPIAPVTDGDRTAVSPAAMRADF
jgi:POT family proton-dependent oligopeptide transporter